MQIQIVISPAASTTTHVASLLFDLWEDYLFHREQAESIDIKKEPLLYKRHVRAAIHSFFGYLEGVLNSWIAKLDSTVDLKRGTLYSKLKRVQRHIQQDRTLPPFDLKRARDIRNTIVHPKPTGEDVELMETLLCGEFLLMRTTSRPGLGALRKSWAWSVTPTFTK